MKSIIEFGPYWSWDTYIFYLVIGLIVSMLCKKAGAYGTGDLNYDKKTELSFKKNDILTIKKEKLYYFLAFFLLFLVSTIRTPSVGPDTPTYIMWFQNALSYDFNWSNIIGFQGGEPLFRLFQYSIRLFTSSNTIYFAISAIPVSWSYICFIKKFVPQKANYTVLVLLIILFQYNLSAARSALGVAFLLFSLCALKDNKNIKSLALAFVGGMFHYTVLSGFLFVLFYILFSKYVIKNKIYTIFFALVAFSIANSQVIFIKSYFMETKYSSYVQETLNWTGYWFFYILILAVLLNYRYLVNVSKDRICISSVLYIAIVLPGIINIGASRVVTYFMLPRIVLWSLIAEKATNSVKHDKALRFIANVIIFIIVAFYVAFRFSRVTNSPGFIYETIFF